jgi:hypothetical protein
VIPLALALAGVLLLAFARYVRRYIRRRLIRRRIDECRRTA